MSTFQLGSFSPLQPLEVQFGPSEYDVDSSSRAIKVYLDDINDQQHIGELDEKLICRDTGRPVIRLKIWKGARVEDHQTKQLLKVQDIKRGDSILAIVRPYNWTFEGRTGTSLTCDNVLVVSRGETSIAAPIWI